MQYINCFIIVIKVLLRLTIKKFDVFVSGWYDCSIQNSVSVQSICKWHCTKYCGTVSQDWRGDKLPSVLVFTPSKILKSPSASKLEPYLKSFPNEKIHIFFSAFWYTFKLCYCIILKLMTLELFLICFISGSAVPFSAIFQIISIFFTIKT